MSDKIMLLDGHSLLNRAFYGLPDLTNAEGKHTNAVLGFLNIMLRYVEEEKPTHLLVAFDRKEPTFRHIKYKEYKGTRKPMPAELHEQVPLMKEVLKTMEIPIITQAGIEADDILGTIGKEAEEAGFDVAIVSGDRDLLQLATKKVKIKIPKTKASGTVTEDYYEEDVRELYGVSPTEFIDMKGLMGDTSDNIPGVPGIGEKTAAKIIKEYHSIENAHDHIEEIKPARAKNNLQEYYEQAIMSKDLATIKKDCDLSYDFKDAKIGTLFTKEAYQLFKELELKSLFKYFDEEEKEEETLEVVTTSDLGEVENIFSSIKKSGRAGLGMIGVSGNCKGISLTWKEGTVLALIGGFVTEDYLKEKIVELLKEGTELIVLDYKALLHFVEEVREYESQIQDVGIQAYLLNPLQSAYDYEDIAFCLYQNTEAIEAKRCYHYIRASILDEILYNEAKDELKLPAQDAREYLFLGVKSEMYYTGYNEDWDNIIEKRLYDKYGKAHENMHVIMQKCKDHLDSIRVSQKAAQDDGTSKSTSK